MNITNHQIRVLDVFEAIAGSGVADWVPSLALLNFSTTLTMDSMTTTVKGKCDIDGRCGSVDCNRDFTRFTGSSN